MNNHYEIFLIQNLRFLLASKGLSIVSFSKKTGTPIQTIHGWLCGSEPKIMSLKRISDFFEISIEDLCFKKLF